MRIQAWMRWCVAACLPLVCVNAQALLVEWSINATVREVVGDAATMANNGVAEGTNVSISFLLDTTVDGTVIATNTWYDGSVVDAQISFGDFDAFFGFDEDLNTTVINESQSILSVSTRFFADDGDNVFAGLGFAQFNTNGPALVGDSGFPAFPDFSLATAFDAPVLNRTFMGFAFSFGGVNTTVLAEMDAPVVRVVPLPGAAYLLGAGLVALLGFRRRA